MRHAAARLAIMMALVVGVALPVWPQDEQKLVESIEVRVVNIDVTVRDRKGNPITGLTKDDFELYENGVRQEITNLYEVRAGANGDAAAESPATTPGAAPQAPAELLHRRLILFVDASTLHQGRKQQVLDALETFVDRQMRPDDEAMLVVWRIGAEIVTPFTRNKADIHLGIDMIGRSSGEASEQMEISQIRRELDDYIFLAQVNRMTWAEAYERARLQIDYYSQRTMAREHRLLEVLGRIMTTFAGTEGKKVIVYAGEHLPERPGAELYQYAYEQFVPQLTGGRTGVGLDMQAISGTVGNDMKDSIIDFAMSAAAHGITIYAIDAAETTDTFSSQNDIATDVSTGFLHYENTSGALQLLARTTGGVAIGHTENYNIAFDAIGRDLESYYSLGYRPQNADRTGVRSIAVKMKNSHYRIRNRASVVIESSEEQMNDRVIANLYTDSMPSAWPISVKTGAPKKDGKNVIIPIVVAMPATPLTLLPQDGSLVGGIVFYFAVANGNGTKSEILRRPKGVKIPPTAEAVIRSKPITFGTQLRMAPGESLLSVAVVDQISGTTGFARTKIEGWSPP